MLATAISAVSATGRKPARSRHLVDPLQQPAPDAGALSRRIAAIWWM